MRILVACLLSTATVASAQMNVTAVSPAQLAYPNTDAETRVEEQFGVKVADPYRWLENDVRQDPKVRAWVTAENAVTQRYLASLPGREAFKARMKQLYDYERFSAPRKMGGRYFYTHNDGLQNQSVLFVRDALDGAGRVLIDPNPWAKDGATALAEWVPSDDGKLLAYSVQDGGTDWRTVKVLDVATGKETGDAIEWVKFSNLAWAKDGSGFYYSRFAQPAGGKFQALNENQEVYFHRLGTPQAQDRKIYATPDRPKLNHTAEVSDDGRYLIVTSSEGTDERYEITLVDVASASAKPRTLIKGLENDWRYIGNQGDMFVWATNKGAPRLRVVTLDVAAANPRPVTIVPEDAATLDNASIVGGTLFASYLVDAKTEVRRYDLKGQKLGTIPLPGIGTASGFGGKPEDDETFFSFSSYATPATVFRYDVKSGQVTPWAEPKVAFNPEDFSVEQRFYASKDGTRVPMFVVRKKGATGPAPTLLYGYGGFNVPVTPGFSPTFLGWVDKGGVLAVANLRGGGEYGKAWHDAGRLKNKQNVFDDFIAAGEYLIREGITGRDQLAVHGGSNGGLLVGAVVNQRPDLFAAALPAVGVMDMLRFDRFTAGRYWVDDYGYPSKEADFRTLYAYSPYHNIKAGKDYPAILVTTADTDDRVVPGHSFKYAAMLQNSAIGPKPHLIRIETRAGHGSGKPTDKIIEEAADRWAFIAKWTGLDVK
jgi:prolyl oligopeptidase